MMDDDGDDAGELDIKPKPITSTDRRRLENALSVILGLPVPLIERAQESITKFLAKDVAKLPTELFVDVMTRLDLPSLARAMRVCKNWRNLIETSPFWQQKYIQMRWRKVDMGNAQFSNLSWKESVRQMIKVKRNWRKCSYKNVTLIGHSDAVYCLQFDDHKIISGSRDNTMKKWDLASMTCVQTYYGHDQSVLCLQYDNEKIVSGSSDSTIKVWDIVTGHVQMTLIGHEQPVLNVRFNDQYIVSCSKDKTLRLWDLQSGVQLRKFEGHTAAVNSFQLVNNLIISASGDRTVKIWNILQGTCVKSLSPHERGIACVQYSPVHDIIATGSSDKTLHLTTLSTGDVRVVEGHTDLVRTLQFDDEKIVTGSYDKTIRVVSLRNPEEVWWTQTKHDSRIFRLQFSKSKLITCAQDNKIIVWDFAHDVDPAYLPLL